MIRFIGWKPFRAFHDFMAVRAFIRDTADETVKVMEKGMRGPHTGRMYGAHRASAPNSEYPAVLSGGLIKSIETRIGPSEATVGTTDFVGFWMREGTTRMEPRKMSDAAMKTALPSTRDRMRNFATWRRT